MSILENRLGLFFLLVALSAQAQVPTEELENKIETIAEGNEENNTDLIQLAENLQLLLSNPIPVNFATKNDLAQIPYLNVFQIANLLRYRDDTGPLYGAFELKVVKGFDETTIAQVAPFLSFATQAEIPDLKLNNIYRYSNHNLLARSIFDLQTRGGYKPEAASPYLGNPGNYYLRYRGTYKNNLSAGFTAQQDPGEPFGGPSQNSAIDFLSGHLALQNYGNLKTLIVGDFQAEFGQGLALWSSLAFGKGAETVEIKRYARGFRPFTGAEENRFLRGVAATWQLQNFELSAFYSNRLVDANPEETDSSFNAINVSSLQTSGLHRTENELAGKDGNRLQMMGANLNWSYKQLETGVSILNHQLELPLAPASQLYQKFRLNGNQLTNASAHFNYLFLDLNIFGEFAFSDNGRGAQSVGIQSHPAEELYATVLFRNIDKEYQFLYNAPFAEGGTNGEQGVYLGLLWQLNANWQLSSYLDFYRFSWPRFRADAPSKGQDYLAQLDWQGSRWFTAYLRVRHESREMNANRDTRIPGLGLEQRSSLRLHFAYNLGAQWRLSSRYEGCWFSEIAKNEQGAVIFQDLRYTFKQFPLRLTSRFALINTPSFDTRIYAYENDLTYAFSIPPYYGQSYRFYLLADWDLRERLSLQAKYALTTFLDRETISSGNQQIDGNQNSEIRLQLNWRF